MRKKPFNLYWAERGHNFGDVLSPILVSHLSRGTPVWSKPHAADLVALGSLLQKVVSKRTRRIMSGRFSPIHIWGSGFIENGPQYGTHLLEVHAVRGTASRHRFGYENSTIAMGDPGFLCRELLPREKRSRKGVLVCPHIADTNSPWIRGLIEKLEGEGTLSDLTADYNTVIDEIVSADLVISSAMHPLIIAMSYGIPCLMISPEASIINGGDYKFEDCFSLTGRPGELSRKALVSGNITLSKIKELASKECDRSTIIDTINEGLINSFRNTGL